MSSVVQGANATGKRGGWARLVTKPLFLLAVVIPTLLSGAYYGVMASDVYVSESHFVVRTPQRQIGNGLGAMLQSAGFARAQDDTYTVHDYIESRDAFDEINRDQALAQAYSSKSVDFFSRFNRFALDGSIEALYQYYRRMVLLEFDTTSAISVLKVNAYSATDATRLNEKLLQMAEKLINDLNERARLDLVRFSQTEVDAALARAQEASRALSVYRSESAMYDPDRESALQLQMVAKIQDDLIATKIQLAQAKTLTPDSPQIPALQKRMEVLNSEIAAYSGRVTGGPASFSGKSAKYEHLMMNREFAQKQLAIALTSMEQARNDAQRKQLYLERISRPSQPDIAVEPHRLRNVLATFILGMILWGIGTLLLASVREHKD